MSLTSMQEDAMPAYGYIRKSVVQDPARMLSPEMQEAEIRRLAAYNGHDDIVVVADLDISGTKDRTKRPSWDRVLTAIETGQCKDLYSYSLSRLARSVDQLSAVRKLCTAQGVGLHLVKEKVDTSSASGRLFWNLQASFEEFWSDVTSERVKDAFAVKRANDPTWKGPGNLPYGSLDDDKPDLVLAAFRQARSFDGAATLLNVWKIPPRAKHRRTVITTQKGGAPVVIRRDADPRKPVWHGTTVAAIVRRLAPDEVPPSSGRGAKAGTRSYRLARVLACGAPTADGGICGTYLTPSRDSRTGEVRYYCHRAKVIEHPRGWVPEAKLLPLVKDEVAYLILRARKVPGTQKDELALAEIKAKRARWVEQYGEGLINKATRDSKLTALANDEATITSRSSILRLTIPADIEHGDPMQVNRHLRAVFSRVVVDMSEKAKRGPSHWEPRLTFEWRDGSLRQVA